MADKELKIKITVDDTGAIQKIEGVDDAVDSAGKSAEKAGDGFSKFQASLLTAEAALNLANRAFDGIQRVAAFTFDTLDRAAQVENLTRSFENLQESIGANATDKINALRTATKGLIADQDLLQAANNAVLLGVDDGKVAFDELTAAALKLGQAQGVTAKQAIDSLVIGIGRQSKLRLDDLGVLIDTVKANEEYAASIGKSAAALDDQERKAAFATAAIKGIREESAKLTDAQETAAQSAGRFDVTIENLTDRFATAFSQNEDLRKSIENLNKRINEINVEAVADDLATFASVLLDVAAAASRVVNVFSLSAWKEYFASDEFQAGAIQLAFFTEQSRELAGTLKAGLDQLKPTAENFLHLNQIFQDLRGEVDKQNIVLGITEGQLRNLGLELLRFEKAASEAEKGQEDITEAFVKGAPKIDKANEKYQDVSKTIKELTAERFDGSLPALEKSVDDAYAAFAASGDLEDFKEELALLLEITKGNEEGMNRLKKAIEGLPEATKETLPEVDSFFDDLMNKGSEAGLGFVVEFQNILTDGRLAGVLSDALFEGATGKETGAALGAQFGGAIGEAIGLSLGAPQLGRFLGDVFGEKAGEELGAGLSDIFDRIFDNKSDPAANARENFFSFLRDAIGRNEALVLIEDEFRPIGELFRELNRDIFDPQEGGIVPIFEELFAQAPEVQSAFLGVGQAITQVFDDVNLDAGQAAALLSQNLGGSLNNLQILIQSLDISFQELEDAMIEAALNGETSFLEAESALRNIGQLAESGIPGQIGAVTEAFNNLKTAGEQGGLFTVDALRDIGAEAAELGATTLQDLRAALEDAGVATDDLNKFFESLAEVGVDSVEELANVTDREAIQVLADLETLAFGFLETTNQAADDLISRLENIPEEIESRIVINVETRAADNGAQQVIDSGQLGLTL